MRQSRCSPIGIALWRGAGHSLREQIDQTHNDLTWDLVLLMVVPLLALATLLAQAICAACRRRRTGAGLCAADRYGVGTPECGAAPASSPPANRPQQDGAVYTCFNIHPWSNAMTTAVTVAQTVQEWGNGFRSFRNFQITDHFLCGGPGLWPSRATHTEV